MKRLKLSFVDVNRDSIGNLLRWLGGAYAIEFDERNPDFVIHSYTKDLSGSGVTTAGVVIARNERMFIPKGDSITAPGAMGEPHVYRWDETLFWNVYYVKGAFLDADKAFDVMNGMRTLELRTQKLAGIRRDPIVLE